jgi:bleomycin hydrolase
MNLKLYLSSLILLVIINPVDAQKRDKGSYLDWKPVEVSTKIENERNRLAEEELKKTEEIRAKAEAEESSQGHYSFKADLSTLKLPESVADFKTEFHFPPAPQDWAQCCWSFSVTSLYESEIYRKTGKKIKLSEMWSVYYEHLEKATRYIESKGESYYAEGSEMNALTRLYNKYGIVPQEAYMGKFCCSVNNMQRRDYVPMYNEIKSYLEWIKENNLWNKEENLNYIKQILNKHMGTPPQKVVVNNKEYSPIDYYKSLNLEVNDYVSLTSTLRFPFYTYNEFLFRDNWWHNKDYFNVPLNEFYETIKKAIKSGYTVGIAGDLSQEAGLYYFDKGLGFIPDFDIPAEYISQEAREFRIYNKTTVDDHAVHMVGYTVKDGQDWFIIKDSGDPGSESNHPGYIFYRGDYIKMKVLSVFIHRDALKDLLSKAK